MEDFYSSTPKIDKFKTFLNHTEKSVLEENEERVQTITASSNQGSEPVRVNLKHVTRDHHPHGINKPNLLKKSLLFRLQKLQLKQVDNNRNDRRSEQQLPEAWSTLPKVGPMDNVGYWRLKTADHAARKLPSAVDGPLHRKVTTAPVVTNRENKGDTIDNTEDASKFSPVQEAFVNAVKLRQSIREDKLAGISTSSTWFLAGPKSNITPKGINKEDTLKVNTENGQNHNVEVNKEKIIQGNEKKAYFDSRFKPPPIPAKFTFPKCKDFIVMQDNVVENLSIGWKINSMFKTNFVESTTYKKHESRGNTVRGQLRKELFPVTEAMNKHGTSVSRRTAKALKPGDITVSKVWSRSLKRESSAVSPYQMAREDVHLKPNPDDEWKIPTDTNTVMSDDQDFPMPRWKSRGSRRNFSLTCY